MSIELRKIRNGNGYHIPHKVLELPPEIYFMMPNDRLMWVNDSVLSLSFHLRVLLVDDIEIVTKEIKYFIKGAVGKNISIVEEVRTDKQNMTTYYIEISAVKKDKPDKEFVEYIINNVVGIVRNG